MDAFTLTIVVLAGLLFAYTRGRLDGQRVAKELISKAEVAVDQAIALAAPALNFEPPVRIGERFTYLGIPMLCTAHVHRQPLTPPMDCVKAEYVADDGTLRMAMWTALDVQALRAEINRADCAQPGENL